MIATLCGVPSIMLYYRRLRSPQSSKTFAKMKSHNFLPMRTSLAIQRAGFHTALCYVRSQNAITAKSSTYLAFEDIISQIQWQMFRNAAVYDLSPMLGLPMLFVSEAQAFLARSLLEAMGSECLMTPGLWKIYQDLPPWLLNTDCLCAVVATCSENTSFDL